MRTPGRRYAFISHAKSDHRLTEELTKSAHEAGLSVWKDADQDYASSDTREILRTAIQECSLFVALLTETSIRRPWVRWEIEEAARQEELEIVAVDCGLTAGGESNRVVRLVADHMVTLSRARYIILSKCRQDDVLIRPRRAEDMAACAAILADVHQTGGYPVHWPADPQHWLTPSRHLTAWVAESAGEVVGHVSLTSAQGEAAAERWSARTGRPVGQAVAVSRLYVAESARGRAIGRQLLDTACAEARHRELHPVLSVLAHNRSAIALYRNAGWSQLSDADLRLPDGRMMLMYCFAAPND